MPPKHPDDHEKPSQSWQGNRCFGCGPDNPDGLHMNFVLGSAGDSYICEFELSDTFSGPPGHAHGGIIATILDEAMGKANKLRAKVALTRSMEVDFFRPVPLGRPLVVEGKAVRTEGRAFYNSAELRTAEGVVLARSRGKFLTIDAEKMFAQEFAKEKENNS